MLPQTKYLDAGPALPEASQAAAQAPAAAAADFGNTITYVGRLGLDIANKVRKAKEAGEIAKFFSEADLEAGEFSNQLLTRTDPQNWPTDWKSKVDAFKERGGNLDLSPEGRGLLDSQIQNWSTQRTLRFEALAATKTVEEGRSLLENRLKDAARRGDRETFNATASLLPGLGVMPSQMEAIQKDAEITFARQELAEEAATDPYGAIARLTDPKFLENNPSLTREDLDYGLKEARKQERIMLSAASDQFQDMVATGEIRNEADLKKVFGENGLPPRVMKDWSDELKVAKTDEELARRATPEYEQQVIGQVEAGLVDLPLEMDMYPQRVVELETLAYTLPTGPSKTRLLETIRNKKDGIETQFKSMIDVAKEDFVTAYKENYLGDSTQKKTVAALIDDGFFRNRKNLLEDGYSETQADIIQGKKINKDTLKTVGITEAEAEKLATKVEKGTFTDSDRISLFRAFRPKRGTLSKLTGYKAQVAGAIGRGDTTVETELDAEENYNAKQKLGKMVNELDNWMKANPKKAEDYDAVQTKKNEILDRADVENFEGAFFKTAPKRQSFDTSIDTGPKGASDRISATPVGNNIKDMVKHFEAGGEKAGFHAKAYDDGKQYSIGYGTKAKPGETISKQEAERRLDSELASHRARVIDEAAKVGIQFQPHEIDALTSFDFNTGSIEKLLAGGTRDKAEIAEKMLLYTKADGKTLRGLENRRKAEAALFQNGYK